jgi:hypothetical protein
METYICNLCDHPFISKFSLERHQQKKKKCNVLTEFKCNKCNKCFAQKKNLIQHTEKDLCKIDVISKKSSPETKNEHAILDILNSKITTESKVKLIKVINSTLIDENILEILNNDIPINTKIILLNTKATVKSQTINNTTNNTINYNFNNFDQENIEYLGDKYLKKLITSNAYGESIFLKLSNEIYLNEQHPENQTINNTTNNTINYNFNNFDQENLEYLGDKYLKKLITSNAYGESIFLKLSNEIYLNEQHPENQTIKIDNLNNKFCKIKENNKWITATKDTALKKIFNKACSIVETIITENKNSISEKQIKQINDYIERDFEDKAVVESVKKLALNIYNFYNSTDI